MKNCPNCNSENQDNAAFCSACGYKFENVEPSVSNETAAPNSATNANAASNTSSLDIASLVMGILGLTVIPVIGGILAIAFANMSKKENAGVMVPMAKAGFIMGIISLAICALAILLVGCSVSVLGCAACY